MTLQPCWDAWCDFGPGRIELEVRTENDIISDVCYEGLPLEDPFLLKKTKKKNV